MPRSTRSCVLWNKRKSSAVVPSLPLRKSSCHPSASDLHHFDSDFRPPPRISGPRSTPPRSPWISTSRSMLARAEEFSIDATGRDREICGNVPDHLILNTYREVLTKAGRPITPLSLRIENDIPIGKGCGSSAAARLAGIALAVHFGRVRWTDAQIIGEASRREHHADNASACWMGGLTVARMSASAQTEESALSSTEDAEVVSLRPKGKWPLLLAVPEQSLATEKARLVLPAQYSRADAVTNRPEFHVPARRLHPGTSRSSLRRARGPHPPAVSGGIVSVAAFSAGVKREGGHSRISPQRRRALRADIPRSARVAAEIAQTRRGPPLEKSIDRRTASHVDHSARCTRDSRQVLADRRTENTLARKCYSRRSRKSLNSAFPYAKLISAACVCAEWHCRHPMRGLVWVWSAGVG